MRSTLIRSEEFNLLELKKLTDKQIRKFADENYIDFNTDLLGDFELLRTPMILTLYCKSEREMSVNSGKYDFISDPLNKGEILHNYIISNMSRLDRRTSKEYRVLHRLDLLHLLPRIAYEMEKDSLFRIKRQKLKSIITDELNRYLSDEFLSHYSCLEDNMTDKVELMLKADSKNILRTIICRTIRRFLETYCMMKKVKEDEKEDDKEDSYAFLHHDYRDYFAALYINTKIQEGINNNDGSFPELTSRVFEPHLINMLGEIIGEPRRKPVITNCYKVEDLPESILNKALRLLHGQDISEDDYRIVNILEVLKQRRVDLSNIDLRNLDLRHIVFNNILSGHGKINSKLYGADFRKSRLKASNFLPHWHSRWTDSVCYSPDGKYFVSGNRDSTIKEWNCFTGECIKTYKGHSAGVTSVRYSPDGSKILTGSTDQTVKLWDRQTGNCLNIFEGFDEYITSIAFSPDGNRIAAGSYDMTIKEWDVDTEYCLNSYEDHCNGITSICYSPDGKKIISGSADKTIKEWDIETGKCLKTYESHADVVTSVNYSPDGDKFISGSSDKTIKEWDVESGECLRTYEGHSDSISCVSYNQDGKQIISSAWGLNWLDNLIREWDINGKCIKFYEGHSLGVTSVAYSPDGKRLISASQDNTIKEWNAVSGKCIRTYQGYEDMIISVIYSPDNKKILAGSKPEIIKEWDLEKGECIKIYRGNSKKKTFITYSDDGKEIVSKNYDTIKEWDINTGDCLELYKIEDNFPICFSPDGNKILSRTKVASFKEWDRETQICIREYKPYAKMIHFLCYNPGGNKILSIADNIFNEWDSDTGKCLTSYEFVKCRIDMERLKYKLSSEKIESIDFLVNSHLDMEELKKNLINLNFSDKDIELIIECSMQHYSYVRYNQNIQRIFAVNNTTVDEFDIVSRKYLRTYEHTYYVFAVSFYHDGKRIICANNNLIDEWDIITGEHIRTYEGYPDKVEVVSIAYSPDGKKIISAGGDNIIKEWDIETGKCIQTIQNISGLFIQGIKMDSSGLEGSDEEKKILKQYGAIIY